MRVAFKSSPAWEALEYQDEDTRTVDLLTEIRRLEFRVKTLEMIIDKLEKAFNGE